MKKEMDENKNKEVYKELSELISTAIIAIKDSFFSEESKTMAFQVLQKAQVPITWGDGRRKMIPLGHIFKEAFENTGLHLTEAYSSFIMPKDAEEKNFLDEDDIIPDDTKVNHPSHYQSYNSKVNIECIDAMQAAFGKTAVAHFCLCNSFKYLWRHSSKGGMQDIDKSLWYLNKYKELNILDLGD